MASVVLEASPDEIKIDSSNALDVEFWAMVLDAFPMHIAHAASLVGTSAHRVQWYLQAVGMSAGPVCH
jgi:hypothetical protein